MDLQTQFVSALRMSLNQVNENLAMVIDLFAKLTEAFAGDWSYESYIKLVAIAKKMHNAHLEDSQDEKLYDELIAKIGEAKGQKDIVTIEVPVQPTGFVKITFGRLRLCDWKVLLAYLRGLPSNDEETLSRIDEKTDIRVESIDEEIERWALIQQLHDLSGQDSISVNLRLLICRASSNYARAMRVDPPLFTWKYYCNPESVIWDEEFKGRPGIVRYISRKFKSILAQK